MKKNRSARRGAAIYGAAALVATCVLGTAGADAEVPATALPVLVPASLQPTDAVPGANPILVGDAEIRNRLQPSSLAIAGERLHIALLRQFYAAHNYERVWATREPQAAALLKAVMRAGEQGLDPDLFHAVPLRNAVALSPTDRELLLSDAFLGYANALAHGAISIDNRMDDEDLKPDPVDVVAALDSAINSPNPAAVIEALAPNSPAYLALRRALAGYQGVATAEAGADTSIASRGRPQADRTNDGKFRQIIVNLERLRWLPRNLPADRIWVNLASAHLVFYRDDQPAFSTRVVVGEIDKQTPELQSTITSLLFNPPWNVPYSIASKEILPKLSQQPDYLARHHMTMRHNGAIQQLPGPSSALGQLKFEMTNRFDVYLHDTPLKTLFGRDNRRQSHGCVRVQNPRELAAMLLQQPVDVINKGIAGGSTNRRMLPTPIPVFLVYQTAVAASEGKVEFYPDVYSRDDEIWQQLHPARQAPVAEHDPVGQRRG